MDSSIIDVDAVADGDYLLQSDDDVSDILQQFREGSNFRLGDSQSGHSLRSVDTRTFTRPKKRVMQNVQSAFPAAPPPTFDLNETPPCSRDCPASLDAEKPTPINLRIGGLVTSKMDVSNLGDVSPPYSSSLIDSQSMMMNSLITSGDFTGVSFFMDNKVDASDVSTLKSFSRFDADDANKNGGETNDIRVSLLRSSTFNKTLERGKLTFCDSKSFESNGDNTFNLGNVTVECNGTFEIENPQLNNTFQCIDSSPKDNCINKQNQTFDCNDEQINSISETPKASVTYQSEQINDEISGLKAGETFELNDQEMPSLNQTHNKVLTSNITIDINDVEMPSMNETHVLNQTQERHTTVFPISTPCVSKNVNKRHTLAFDLSPIPMTNATGNSTAKKRIDLDLSKPSEIELEKFLNDGSRSTPDEVVKEFVELRQKQTHELSQEERESLMNFEEFEKSLRLIEDKGNDDQELDEILNSFSSIRKSIQNEKMRQSLDNIKKRHSLINLEKQQEDLRRKEVDSNKLSDSIDKSMAFSMSSSTGERLLNRRSRICDYNEQVVASAEETHDELTKSLKEIDKDREKHMESKLSPPSCKSRYNNVSKIYLSNTINIDEVPSDNREDEITTELENNRNLTQSPVPEAKGIGGKKAADRDRFKTIRIFKRGEPKPNPNIPTIDQYNEPEPIKGVSRMMKRDGNSPKSLQQPLDNKEKDMTVESKMKTFTRPTRFLSGLRKPGATASNPSSVKSSSYDNLDKDYHVNGTNEFVGASAVPELKSPMGIKSKSVHNLMYSGAQGGSKLQQFKSRLPSDKPLEFKQPQPVSSNLRKLQAPSALRKPNNGMVRPSSGYYNGYGSNNQVNHRNDSDTESGRYSPTNSLSSASSRGSLSRQDAIEGSRIRNSSVPPMMPPPPAQIIAEQPKATLTGGVKTGIPKPSGLRPPSTVRRSALPRPKSIVRR